MLKATFLIFLFSSTFWGATTVKFSTDPTGALIGTLYSGPFPSNVLTTPDASKRTGLVVALPPAENSCDAASGAVCSNNAALNQLDGFSVNPRVMVCFSAAVNPSTLPSGLIIVPVGGSLASSITVNQVIFDPTSHCAFAKPKRVLKQESRYLLLIKGSVKDTRGNAIEADTAFPGCVKTAAGPYCAALAQSLARLPVSLSAEVVGASLFTTMSATIWLEQARRFVDLLPAFSVPAGFPSTFRLANLAKISWVPDQSGSGPQEIPISALSNVGRIAFGLYLSPNYLNTSGSSAGTITTSPVNPTGYLPVSFHVFLPSKSANQKIPVVIYGHGLSDSQFGAPTYIASTLAKSGFATLALEITGHGYGPAGVVNLTETNGEVNTVYTPGRGVQLAPGRTIGPTDGCISPGAAGVRDCARQSAVDLAALVHTIRATDGLGLNLDQNRIYYIGQSFGSIYGTLFHAVDPAVRAAVFSGDGGTEVDISRLAITGRALASFYLASLNDVRLLNVIAGLAPPQAYFHDYFNDNYVFRDQPPVINFVGNALAVQAAFEAADWLGMPGDALAFAPHLKTSPLFGMPAKHSLFQFGYGDLEVPNPTESAIVRAADAQSETSYLHFEAAAALQPELLTVQDPATPGLPILPHRILSNPTIFDPANGAERSLAFAEQEQAANYFRSGGTRITDPDLYLTDPFTTDENLFATPPFSLPENLNFIQIGK